jgi:hypothetical protein
MAAISRVFFRVGLASVCAAAAVGGQDIGPYSIDEWNAVNVLQGAVRTPIIDSATIAITATAMRAIRGAYPDVRGIPTGEDETVLDLMLTPLLSAQVARANGRPFEPSAGHLFEASTLGSGALDSLDATYHVRHLLVEYFFGAYFVHLRFGSAVNVPVVVGAYRGVPGVRWAGQPQYAGYEGMASRVVVVVKPPLWHFIFVRDSWRPSEKRLYYFTFDARSGLITPLGDGSIARIRTQGVPLWARSGGTSLQAYDSYGTLLAATGDSAWWVRRAAVEVLGFLFEHPNDPWGRDCGDTARCVALKDSVWAHHVDVLHLLRRAQRDTDDDVRDAATVAVRKAQGAGVVAE